MIDATGGRGIAIRRLAIVVLALGAAVMVLRDLSARAPVEHPLSRLAPLWIGHPASAERIVIAATATAAKNGRPIDPAAASAARDLLADRPLAVTPFLVAGADAQTRGDLAIAERRYRAARLRDPRAPATRVLLADLYLRGGRVRAGLDEMLALTRIAPRAANPIGPALAAYARTPGGAAQLKPVLDANPAIQGQVLAALAADSRNRNLVLALAPVRAAGADPQPWEAPLLSAMVNAGQVADAKALWARWTGRPDANSLLVNADFQPTKASPPFNWELLSGPAGLAEIPAEGGLSIIHYGREPMLMVRQLLALTPGRYKLSVRGETSDDLSVLDWTLRCTAGQDAGQVRLNPGGQGAGVLTVPGDCPAQWLELHARMPEVERTSEGRIRLIALERLP